LVCVLFGDAFTAFKASLSGFFRGASKRTDCGTPRRDQRFKTFAYRSAYALFGF
jgi:hypothetical protein